MEKVFGPDVPGVLMFCLIGIFVCGIKKYNFFRDENDKYASLCVLALSNEGNDE